LYDVLLFCCEVKGIQTHHVNIDKAAVEMVPQVESYVRRQ
jgi:hypothetical protein